MEDSIKKLAALMANKKGYAQGGRVSMSDIYEQNVEKRKQEELAKEALEKYYEDQQAKAASDAFSRAASQQDGNLAYSGSKPNRKPADEPADMTPEQLFEREDDSGAEFNPGRDMLATEAAAPIYAPPTGKTKINSALANDISSIPAPTPAFTAPAPSSPSVAAGPASVAPMAAASPSLPVKKTPERSPSNDPYGSELNDNALKEAQQQAKLMRLFGGLGNASSMIGAALSRGATQAAPIGKDLIENADQDSKNILQRREGKDKEVSRNKNLLELATEKEKSEPTSQVSMFGQEITKKLAENTGIRIGDVSKLSYNQLKEIIPGLERYDAALESQKMRKDTKAFNESLARERMDIKKEEKLDKDITKHSERLKKNDITSAIETLREVDSLLPNGLDSDKGDIPGYGLGGGLTPSFMTSGKGQKLRQAVQRLANTQLKDRSGSAVSDKEYQRFKDEFGNGTWKTESQLLNGLRQYRNVLQKVTTEIEASAPKEALSEYLSREGSSSSTQIPGNKQDNTQKNSNPNVRIVDGVKYNKVDGGWEQEE